MTANQLKYLELMQTSARDAWNRAVAEGQLSELTRHNSADERIKQQANEVNWFNAKVNQYNASVNMRNAETNARNADSNAANAISNRISAHANQQNAESNRITAFANQSNAESNRMNAYTNQRNASINYLNAQIAQQRANTEYQAMLSDRDYKQRSAAVMEGNADVQRLLWSTQTDESWARARSEWAQKDLIDEKAKTEAYQRSLLSSQVGLNKANTDRAKAETALAPYRQIEMSASALNKAALTDKAQFDMATGLSNVFGNTAKAFMKLGGQFYAMNPGSVALPVGP